MKDFRLIRTKADYEAAAARIDALIDAQPGTPEGDELELLALLVERYEDQHVSMPMPSPIEAIKFRMEQQGLGNRDLEPMIGSKSKVSEVLSGKRPLTLSMMRALHEQLGIPADVLLQHDGATLPDSLAGVVWEKFPVLEMGKLGWFGSRRVTRDRSEELMRSLIAQAGGPRETLMTMFRRNDHARRNAKADPYALIAWCYAVLRMATQSKPAAVYEPGSVTLDFMRAVAALSVREDGPKQAQEFLSQHGIRLVVLQHLSRTHLDGAATKLSDGTPVIGMTLRYDRLDNFWFCLLHELAHISKHLDTDDEVTFVDDLTLETSSRSDHREVEADKTAEEALLPRALWQNHPLREMRPPSPGGVISLANELRIHPAIVAGRLRYEQKNYRLLSHFVGVGEVQRHFPEFASS